MFHRFSLVRVWKWVWNPAEVRVCKGARFWFGGFKVRVWRIWQVDWESLGIEFDWDAFASFDTSIAA